jgi:hypothetical protein
MRFRRTGKQTLPCWLHPGLTVIQGGLPYFTVLGDMFIKNRYVVLSYGQDQTNIQVGLGDRADIPPIF